MKNLLRALLLLSLTYAAKAQNPAYTFPIPQGWGSEKIPMPIKFAPKIPFTGMEELRFVPDWGKATSAEYWSYAFLWYVDGTPKISAQILENYLKDYYDGLYLTNLGKKPRPKSDFTEVKIRRLMPKADDTQTFEGTITTLDFLTGNPIKLYALIHMHESVDKHTVFLNEISPKEYKDPVWPKLDSAINAFKSNN